MGRDYDLREGGAHLQLLGGATRALVPIALMGSQTLRKLQESPPKLFQLQFWCLRTRLTLLSSMELELAQGAIEGNRVTSEWVGQKFLGL